MQIEKLREKFENALSAEDITDGEIEELNDGFLELKGKSKKELKEKLLDYINASLKENSPYSIDSIEKLDIFNIEPYVLNLLHNYTDIYEYTNETYAMPPSIIPYLRSIMIYAINLEKSMIERLKRELKGTSLKDEYRRISLEYAATRLSIELQILEVQQVSDKLDYIYEEINEMLAEGEITDEEHHRRNKNLDNHALYITIASYCTYLQIEQSELILKATRKKLQGIPLTEEEKLKLDAYDKMVKWQQAESNIYQAEALFDAGKISEEEMQDIVSEGLMSQFEVESTIAEETLEYYKTKIKGGNNDD